jgi:hypothetical protein
MFLLLASFIISLHAFSNSCDSNDFKKLIRLSNKQIILPHEFDHALNVVNRLDNQHCSEYEKKINGEIHIESNLTFLLGKICCKVNSAYAVSAFVQYMHNHAGSADEELSLSFEKLFSKYPEAVLKQISKPDDNVDVNLINHLVWGFVNNHHVTVSSYKKVFFSLNPNLKRLRLKYRKQIDRILLDIEDELT